MSSEAWYAKRNDRQLRYAGRVLPQDRPIVIAADAAYAATFDGQVAALVAINLLARMTPAVVLDIPEVAIVPPLPWAGAELLPTMLGIARGADPYATFAARKAREGEYVLTLGSGPADAAVHGSGWYAFVGPGCSPIAATGVPNPIGPAFAVIAAAARLFARELAPLDGPFLFDTFRWSSAIAPTEVPYRATPELGTLWAIGAGSVGTAALYFLTLATRRFSARIFDMDVVKVENLDRSPIFAAADAERARNKDDVVANYLRSVGVCSAEAEHGPLDLSSRWLRRSEGEPDLVIAAANERNVRYILEQSCPPLQIYGTTGANWNASVLRHIPVADACSCCVFPPDMSQAVMGCATGTAVDPESGQQVDAALPFLSFAAGLMAAAEVLKAGLPGYPFSPNRTVFATSPSIMPKFTSLTAPRRPGCLCEDRSPTVHRRMLARTRYAHL